MKYGDLKDQIGAPYPRPVLRCDACGKMYSAHRGDYWDRDQNEIITCCGCGSELRRVVKHVTYVEA